MISISSHDTEDCFNNSKVPPHDTEDCIYNPKVPPRDTEDYLNNPEVPPRDTGDYFSNPKVPPRDTEDCIYNPEVPPRDTEDCIYNPEVPLDICRNIINFIKNDNDKCRLLMICKEISRCNFYFNENIHAFKIINSQWFDRFTNVTVNKEINKLPLNVTHLTFDAYFNKSIYDHIPSTITHLRIYCDIEFVNRKLPISITDLYFNGNDEKIFHYLPPKLIQLRFNTSILASMNVAKPIMRKLMENKFPKSVKKIIFEGNDHHLKDKLQNLLQGYIPHVEVSFEY